MSDSTAPSLNGLPVEILHCIFHHLDIPDIVQLRGASRYFHDISRSRDVWGEAYRRAEFVRPPGPFLSQSAGDLEKMLVTSFRVHRNVRRKTFKPRKIRYTGRQVGVSLVFGRFLVIAFSNEVRSHDLSLDTFDSNSGASIIYRSTGDTLTSFHCVSAIDVEGHPFACVVLSETMRKTAQISIYSARLGEGSDMTLDLLHQFNRPMFIIDVVDIGPRVIAITYTDGGFFAMDVHTRTQFLLPPLPFERTEDTDNSAHEGIIRSFSTSTHLLLARPSCSSAAGWSTSFQAFALPPLDMHRRFTSSPILLSPSHRGTIPGLNIRLTETPLLHDSFLDPTTADVLIAIRVHAFEQSRPFNPLSKHGILRLGSAARSDHAVGTITFQLLGFLGRPHITTFLHPSLNGFGRVFYMDELNWSVSVLEYDLHARGGYDDCKGEAQVTEYQSIASLPPSCTKLLDYDPYSGRICLQSDIAKYRVIEVLDFDV